MVALFGTRLQNVSQVLSLLRTISFILFAYEYTEMFGTS
jgi:hypothetical protein